MKTVPLLAVAYPALAGLALAPAVPVLSPGLCLVALLVTGELWLRVLIREPLAPAARLGLAIAAGLVSLPLLALVLHVLGVRIEGRWLAAGLALLVTGFGACAGKRAPVGSGNPPHPVHWVGGVDQPGTTTSPQPSTSSSRSSTGWYSRLSGTPIAVAVPALLSILIGGTATVVYQRLPHPPEPGYTSLALSGWAAGIARPVTFPAAGLEVPLEVSSAGERPAAAHLLVRVGGRIAGPGIAVTITAGTQSVQVHIPAPTDSCLHAVRISLGPASTVFYGRGPVPTAARPGSRPAKAGAGAGAVPC